MVAGTSYTLVASSGTCTPAESAPFSNQAQIVAPATPTVAGTPATCAADGSSTISNYNAAYAYTFTPAGPTVATGGIVTNMTTGTNYQVAASDSACTSAPSADFSNQAMLTGQACDTTTTGVYNLTNTTAVINVFPNPAVNQATIQLSGLQQAQDEATLQVTNNMGQLVYSQQLLNYNNPVKLNIATYQQGIYTINIRFGNGWVAKGRLVKE
jgi:hypothetical protein